MWKPISKAEITECDTVPIFSEYVSIQLTGKNINSSYPKQNKPLQDILSANLVRFSIDLVGIIEEYSRELRPVNEIAVHLGDATYIESLGDLHLMTMDEKNNLIVITTGGYMYTLQDQSTEFMYNGFTTCHPVEINSMFSTSKHIIWSTRTNRDNHISIMHLLDRYTTWCSTNHTHRHLCIVQDEKLPRTEPARPSKPIIRDFNSIFAIANSLVTKFEYHNGKYTESAWLRIEDILHQQGDEMRKQTINISKMLAIDDKLFLYNHPVIEVFDYNGKWLFRIGSYYVYYVSFTPSGPIREDVFHFGQVGSMQFDIVNQILFVADIKRQQVLAITIANGGKIAQVLDIDSPKKALVHWNAKKRQLLIACIDEHHQTIKFYS